MSKISLYNMDCMEAMAKMPDKAFDLAIVDPPYGIGGDAINADRVYKGSGKLKNRALQQFKTDWDIAPPKEYFVELFRISKAQIIWGGNYFELPRNRGFVVWDKKQPWPNFSAAEYAWISFDVPSKIFTFDNRTFDKIHPTQKPVKLYEWLLTNYAKKGDKILDTHLGSGSIAIACYNLGFDLEGYELDKDYYDAAVKRLDDHKRQGRLFEPKDIMVKG